MGAWGTGAFENDLACDWAEDLTETDDPVAALRRTLETCRAEEYLDADAGSEGIAAAAVVAHACPGGEAVALPLGLGAPALPADELPGLRRLADEALQAALGEESELAELWHDSDEDGWAEECARLRTLLAAS